MSIQDEAKQVVARIVTNYQPQKVILFGSSIKNQATNNPDIDLLIVKNTDKKKPFRIKEIFASVRGLTRQYPLDPKVFTPDELAQRITLGDYFINDALKGKVMYEAR